MISLRTAIKREVEIIRAMAGPKPGETESGRAHDYDADQLSYLLDTEDEHRESHATDFFYDWCPWCCLERPKAERLGFAQKAAEPVELEEAR